MSLIVQTLMRLLNKGGKGVRPGERRCAECGRSYRPVPGDRGRCAACERESGGDRTDDQGRPFRED